MDRVSATDDGRLAAVLDALRDDDRHPSAGRRPQLLMRSEIR